VQILIMLAIGGAAGAASITHIHNVASAHGQPGWLAWADAVVLELMSIAAGLELRRRRRERTSTRFPSTVLGCAVVLSLAAQVVEAEPSPIGWITAAVPALGFLVMVKVALGHAGGPSDPQPPSPVPVEHQDRPAAATADVPADRDSKATDQRPTPISRRARGPSADRDDIRTLLPAARTVRDELAARGEPLTRGALARHLRTGGNSVSNSKLSALLRALKSEREPPTIRQHRDNDQLPTDPRLPRSHAAAVNLPEEGGDTS
jgi:hypothetical protein